MYSLKEAADAAGKGKPAILKAIKNGRISANKNERGEWELDPVELHRVYPPVSGNGSGKRQETGKDMSGNSSVEREVDLLREQLGRLEAERDRERRQLEGTIEDLRGDRDHWRQQATALLTDQRQPQAGAGFWRRLFRRT